MLADIKANKHFNGTWVRKQYFVGENREIRIQVVTSHRSEKKNHNKKKKDFFRIILQHGRKLLRGRHCTV